MAKVIFTALTLIAIASPAIAGGTSAPAAGKAPVVRAVSVGEYMISDLRAAEGAKLRISFELYIDADDEHLDELHAMVGDYRHRIRSEVIVAIRTSEQTDFEEPGLDRMRRRILARLKRALPELPIDKLYVGAFQYFSE